jgi:hypothetical protein
MCRTISERSRPSHQLSDTPLQAAHGSHPWYLVCVGMHTLTRESTELTQPNRWGGNGGADHKVKGGVCASHEVLTGLLATKSFTFAKFWAEKLRNLALVGGGGGVLGVPRCASETPTS